MAIEIKCTGCQRVLRVEDQHAGKRARCPQCNAIVDVPASRSDPTAPSPSDRTGRAEQAAWHMMTPEGQTYGPVGRAELENWVKEGRVTEDCKIAPDSNLGWKSADHFFPELRATYASPQAFGASAATNPYVSPVTSGQRVSYQQPHRGGLILAFGILGWLVCAIFAPFAWFMGNEDLRAMNSGHMDPSGRGLTQAGQILGMVLTILMGLAFVAFFLFMLMAIGFQS